MNKTADLVYRRLYLIERLPEPLEPKSAHLQIFDNYIHGTRLRLRLLRDPATKAWTRIMQQHIDVENAGCGVSRLFEIHLNEAEYAAFETFEGSEIRKNRYFHEFDGVSFAFDVYLGDLWGLNTAKVEFANAEEMDAFEPPAFAIFDVTNEPFFLGKNLVGRKFDDVRERVAQIGSDVPPEPVMFED
jgi:CYTH domain-containing protein